MALPSDFGWVLIVPDLAFENIGPFWTSPEVFETLILDPECRKKWLLPVSRGSTTSELARANEEAMQKLGSWFESKSSFFLEKVRDPVFLISGRNLINHNLSPGTAPFGMP